MPGSRVNVGRDTEVEAQTWKGKIIGQSQAGALNVRLKGQNWTHRQWDPLKILGQRNNTFSGRGTGSREAWHVHPGVGPHGVSQPQFSSCRLVGGPQGGKLAQAGSVQVLQGEAVVSTNVASSACPGAIPLPPTPSSGLSGFPTQPWVGPHRLFLPLWLSGSKWEVSLVAAVGCGV